MAEAPAPDVATYLAHLNAAVDAAALHSEAADAAQEAGQVGNQAPPVPGASPRP